jgi:hypothetical protein
MPAKQFFFFLFFCTELVYNEIHVRYTKTAKNVQPDKSTGSAFMFMLYLLFLKFDVLLRVETMTYHRVSNVKLGYVV